MVFQDPMTSLNPVLTIGRQITRGARGATSSIDRKAAEAKRAVELLGQVGIPARPAAGSATTRTSSRAACGSG